SPGSCRRRRLPGRLRRVPRGSAGWPSRVGRSRLLARFALRRARRARRAPRAGRADRRQRGWSHGASTAEPLGPRADRHGMRSRAEPTKRGTYAASSVSLPSRPSRRTKRHDRQPRSSEVQAKDCVKENANNVRRVPSGCPIRSGVGRLAVAAPGLLAALGIAWLGGQLAQRLGRALFVLRDVDPAGRTSPISAISMAVLLGILLANTVRLPALLQPGLDLARKRVLRLGIVLIGLKLSVLDVIRVGAVGLPVVIVLVTFAFAISLWLARRLAVSRELGSLAAASTAICGITATLAVAPVVRADDREVAYTVANVTLIGLLGMLVYPYVAHALFGDSSLAAGLFLGTSIHDTSQVMGAALTYAGVRGDERALQIATITKLTLN